MRKTVTCRQVVIDLRTLHADTVYDAWYELRCMIMNSLYMIMNT